MLLYTILIDPLRCREIRCDPDRCRHHMHILQSLFKSIANTGSSWATLRLRSTSNRFQRRGAAALEAVNSGISNFRYRPAIMCDTFMTDYMNDTDVLCYPARSGAIRCHPIQPTCFYIHNQCVRSSVFIYIRMFFIIYAPGAATRLHTIAISGNVNLSTPRMQNDADRCKGAMMRSAGHCGTMQQAVRWRDSRVCHA